MIKTTNHEKIKGMYEYMHI